MSPAPDDPARPMFSDDERAKFRRAFKDAADDFGVFASSTPMENHATGMLVGQILTAARNRGIRVQARAFSDLEEGATGADLEIVLVSGTESKGVLFQAKRGGPELRHGVSDLKKPRSGGKRESQWDTLGRDPEAAGVMWFNPDGGIEAVRVRDLPPDGPSTADLRDQAAGFADFMGDVIDCNFGRPNYLQLLRERAFLTVPEPAWQVVLASPAARLPWWLYS